jgi:ATP-dependent DNA helicase PIF1
MRFQTNATNTNNEDLRNFSQWLLDVCDGKLGEPNDGFAQIRIPDEFLIKEFDDPLQPIVSTTYPNLLHNFKDEDFLRSRAILVSTIDTVDKINDFILQQIPREPKDYYSCDSIDFIQLSKP